MEEPYSRTLRGTKNLKTLSGELDKIADILEKKIKHNQVKIEDMNCMVDNSMNNFYRIVRAVNKDKNISE